jgi:hypothetical protein
MKSLTQQYMHEAAETLPKVRKEFADANSMNASLCERGFASGVELTIKAYEFEMTGKVTHTHSITAICQSCGLWGVLPSDLQSTVQEWAPFDPNVRYADTRQNYTLVHSTTAEKFDRMTTKALELHSFVTSLLK